MPSRRTSTLSQTVVLSLVALWIIGGFTYLAIEIGLETLPPFLMQGIRFTVSVAEDQ